MLRQRRISIGLLAVLVGCGDESTSGGPQPPAQDCPAGEILLADGTCLRPGIGVCPEGFEREGDHGCVPILPADDCPPGQLALPGDDTCRPPGDCGDGPWGDIPVDDTTVFVDEAGGGTSPDGTMANPYPTIGEAVTAVADGGLVAVAAGTYPEEVTIADRAVRLWGRCPAMVEIAAPNTTEFGIRIAADAHGTEVRDLALTQRGIGVSGSLDVRLDGLWVHHVTGTAIAVTSWLGPVGVTIADTLIESPTGRGIRIDGGELEVRRTMVRDSTSDSTEPRGIGIHAQPFCTDQACDAAQRPTLVVADSHITRVEEAAVFVMGGDALVERSVVTATKPRPSDGMFGEGIVAEPVCLGTVCDLGQRASVTVRQSYVAANHTAGVFAMAADVIVESSVIRDTRQREGLFGRGAHVQILCTELGCDHSAPGSLLVAESVIDRNLEAGLWNLGSELTVTASVIRDTLPAELDALFGDGIGVMRQAGAGGSTQIERSLLSHPHRAGIASFGADVSVAETTIQCAPIALNADPYDNNPATIVDGGGNVCRCGDTVVTCKALSASLAPPGPLLDP